MVNCITIFKIFSQLGHYGGKPARQGSRQRRGRQIGAVCHKAYNVHQAPGDIGVVGGGLPAVSGLVEGPQLRPLIGAGGQPHADIGFDSLPLLNGGEQRVLLPGLKAPGLVVQGDLHGAVRQGQAGEISVMYAVEAHQDPAAPALKDAGDQLQQPQPAAGQAPPGHRQPDVCGGVDGKSVKGQLCGRVAGDGLGEEHLLSAAHLHGKVLGDTVNGV